MKNKLNLGRKKKIIASWSKIVGVGKVEVARSET